MPGVHARSSDFQIATQTPWLSNRIVLTIAIGIAANVTVFSFIRHTLLGSLALRDSGRLVQIWQTNPLNCAG